MTCSHGPHPRLRIPCRHQLLRPFSNGWLKSLREPDFGDRRPVRRPYLPSQIPDPVLRRLGQELVFRISLGLADTVEGDRASIWAQAVGGERRSDPLVLATVEVDDSAWCIQYVSEHDPFSLTQARILLGYISLYKLGKMDPYEDPTSTARAILAAWNQEVNAARGEYSDLRLAVLVSNLGTREFVLFEEEVHRLSWGDYEWRFQDNHSLEGFERATGLRCFSWDPVSTEFLWTRQIPISARRFRIRSEVGSVDRRTGREVSRVDEGLMRSKRQSRTPLDCPAGFCFPFMRSPLREKLTRK